MREALDFLAAHQPGDFAPARPLPPKPFERTIFRELPVCFAAVQSSDPAWVHALLLSKLDAMMLHLGDRWQRRGTAVAKPRNEQIDDVATALSWHVLDPDELVKLLDGLQRLPEGKAWLETNIVFVEGIRKFTVDPEKRRYESSKSDAEQQADWLTLSNRLRSLFLTNVTMEATNTRPSAAAPSVP
jgi:hypothetical protein